MSEAPNTTGAKHRGFPTARRIERALVVVPARGRDDKRTPEDRLEEAVGLARAIDLDVCETVIARVGRLRPSTYFGSGRVAELAALVRSAGIDVAILDAELSPAQQRNLERRCDCKVVDRTGLILEIFGERASTREGRLQVELAHLTYQKSRLVRSWTHLERQRGGFGFLGGPGETQIESDRRMIAERVQRIRTELGSVVTRRRLQRRNRERAHQSTVALVGYTNAGKSTLFNALTHSDVFAHDQLFATLDPTLRRFEIPGGGSAILSDTVGFVADLPTTLIAAFRATLEEVVEADLIIHLRDATSPNAGAQAEDVGAVLSELGIQIDDPERVVEVWNKIDLLSRQVQSPARKAANGGTASAPLAISAATGQGIGALLKLIADRLVCCRNVYRVTLAGDGLARLHMLYELGEVLDRTDDGAGVVTTRVRVPEVRAASFKKAFPEASGEAQVTPESE